MLRPRLSQIHAGKKSQNETCVLFVPSCQPVLWVRIQHVWTWIIPWQMSVAGDFESISQIPILLLRKRQQYWSSACQCNLMELLALMERTRPLVVVSNRCQAGSRYRRLRCLNLNYTDVGGWRIRIDLADSVSPLEGKTAVLVKRLPV